MSEQRARRAAEGDPASKAAVRQEPQRTPCQAPSTFVRGIKDAMKATADNVLDWYAAQSKTLRVGLLGGVGAFCLMGVLAAASSALTPTPVTTWANVPSNPATSMSVRVSGSAGPVPSTAAPSASAPSNAQLPSASETAANPTTTATATSKSTTATTQRTTAAPTQTQPPGHTTDPTTAVPSPTTAPPTTAPPTTAPPTTAPPTTAPPTTAPPTTDPPTTDPPTTDPTE